jgi:hypothetical protein
VSVSPHNRQTITTKDRRAAANIGLAKWRLKYFYKIFMNRSIVVILLNFCAKNPPFRQVENRLYHLNKQKTKKSNNTFSPFK